MPKAARRRVVALSAKSEPEISIAEVAQHFGNAGHAGSAHANEMNVFDCVLHFASSSQAATTASGGV